MAKLEGQSIASSYEQLLHVDRDGGGNTTTLVDVKDGKNTTTFALKLATDKVRITSTNKLEFGDDGTYIHQSADGVLDLVSDTTLELNATTIDVNGALDVSGDVTLSGTNTLLVSNGNAASPRYAFSNSATTGLFLPSNNALGIATNGVERINISDTGLVGIGVSASTPLHIKQDNSTTDTTNGLLIENDGTGDAVAQFLLTGTKRWMMGIDNSDTDTFKIVQGVSDLGTADGLVMAMDTSGNVGIGGNPVTTYGRNLNIKTSSASSAPALTLSNTATDIGDGGTVGAIESQAGAGNRIGGILFKQEGTSANSGDISFTTASSGSLSEKMRLLSDGKLGIGDTTPNAPLTVKFTDNSTNTADNSSLEHNSGLYLNNESTTNESYAGVGFRSNNVDGALALVYEGSDNTGRFSLNMEGSEKLVVKSTGKVGIGDDNPDRNLGVKASNASIAIEDTGGGFSELYFADATDSSGYFSYAHGTDILSFGVGGGNRFKLDANSRISLSNNDGGDFNTVFGNIAGDDLTSNSTANSFFGHNSGHAVDTGDYNVAMGINSLDASTNAQRVVALGSAAIRGNATADAEGAVAVGYASLNALTSGAKNIAIGHEAQYSQTTGSRNTVIGHGAMRTADGGEDFNTIIGSEAGYSINNDASHDNVLIGKNAMQGGTGSVIGNIGIGSGVMNGVVNNNQTGTIAIGHQSLYALTSGAANTAVGYESLAVCTTGKRNTALGYQTLYANMNVGDNNTAVGYSALYTLNPDTDDHGYNTALGSLAGYYQTTGTGNTLIGAAAAASGTNNLTTGDNNTVVGQLAEVSASGAMNQTIIGCEATGVADNSVVLGNENVTAVYMAQDSGATVHAGGLLVGASSQVASSQITLEDATLPFVTLRNTATPDGSKTGGRLDFNLANGTSKPTQANDTVGNIVFLGQGNDADFGSASISNVITTGGNVGRADQVSKLVFTTKNSGQNGADTALTINGDNSVAITGALSKGSGSFKIDHPLESKKDTHHLVHSFVESPQANNIYRGKVNLVSGLATINLDTVSNMTDGTFVLLNTDIQCFTTNESDWDNVKGSVSGNKLTISCQNTDSSATISWMVIGERQDKHIMETNWTDENGKVIVEPLKSEE